ncbi:MAG TPA: hypothetical protein DD850_08940 [Erwinia persicina]|uniref:hypothetical protein n=1 Tax=Erwinia persicina TaxID=55211 RepID=UPI000E4B1748|nr:hypothetical protein [Erwinia persicina]AXU94650.1 hypothetical protein CI789_05000 [Erwinia persicina]MBD8167207.1 hypothetical protein [Erwinia persicina]MCQ4104810.1 hypothetical protein [Erwinia persicina]QZQ51780.1 hypothetical protein K6L24_08470 [Erwinia persicina]UTX14531.1 hypothetical protein NOG67_08625 [Erwinia persicina]
MNTELSPSPAYGQLHAALLEQRSRAASAEAIHTVNRALLAGERVSAAFYDLSLLKLLQQRKIMPLTSPETASEIARFIAELTPVIPDHLSGEAEFCTLQQRVNQLSEHFHWQHASLVLVQNALFVRTWQHWQQTLETLFSTGDHAIVFQRLEQVLHDSSGKIPVLGEARELYRALEGLLIRCRQKAEEHGAEQTGLVGYVAAADIATQGIITFGATAEAVLRGRALPTEAQLAARIKQHHASVTDRTHPWFATL